MVLQISLEKCVGLFWVLSKREIGETKTPQRREANGTVRFLGAKEKQRSS